MKAPNDVTYDDYRKAVAELDALRAENEQLKSRIEDAQALITKYVSPDADMLLAELDAIRHHLDEVGVEHAWPLPERVGYLCAKRREANERVVKLAKERDALRAQRDELLAACEAAKLGYLALAEFVLPQPYADEAVKEADKLHIAIRKAQEA